ncbi:MAG: glycosyltransferase [Nitrospirae bacterium]|nr:glycosyltransferase [Nitrospirota bacterium]
MKFPRISIVTPSLNQSQFLEAAIDSILGQNYPNLEYIIVDGGSTDGSVEIIRRYDKYLKYWVSEPDKGHADALNKGFAQTSGEIMGWLNSDDKLHPGSLELLAEVYAAFPYIDWTMGVPTHWDEAGRCIKVDCHERWSRGRLLCGRYRWIQQESTWWRRSLWEKAGCFVSNDFKLACDLELWVRFSRYADLYTMPFLVGGYRCNDLQRSHNMMDRYTTEAADIIGRETVRYGINRNLLKLVRLLYKSKDVGGLLSKAGFSPEAICGGKLPLYYDRDGKCFRDPNQGLSDSRFPSFKRMISSPRFDPS